MRRRTRLPRRSLESERSATAAAPKPVRRRSRSRARASLRRARGARAARPRASARARSSALVGPSGCGKSTLLELVAGLREPTAGTIAVGGEPAAAERLAALRLHAPARPAAALAVGDRQRRARAAQPRRLARRGARARPQPLFERFGLAGFERSRPAELSGGMRQRVAFLRTLLAGKPVLLLDEPFASLDAITRAEMQEWLARRARRRAAHGRSWSPTTSRRRSTSPTGCSCSPRGPARIVAELAAAGAAGADRAADASPRPAFVAAARAGAARPLRGGARDERAGSPPLAVDRRAARRSGSWPRSWDVLADALDIEPFLVPAPSEIAESLWDDRELLADNAWVTLQEVAARASRSRSSSGVALRGRAAPLRRCCAAPSTRCSSPRRRSR